MKASLIPRIVLILMLMTFAIKGRSQVTVLAKPSIDQLAFQNMEIGVFIHFSIDTYAAPGSVSGSTPASSFNPTNLNADQWVLAAKAMGAKYVVLTARHEQGFCLWPTSTTDYSIKSSPYKNGHGDIVREFVVACRKYGMKVGLYTAPWIDSHWESIHNGYKGGQTANIDKLDKPEVYTLALKKEKQQIKELMTNYGPLVFIWDDHFGRSDVIDSKPLGGKFREFYTELTSYAHSLQPHCLLLGRDVEHVGNEDAITMEDLRQGQKISKYTIEAKINGQWNQIVNGETVGHKRIDQFANVTATALRFTVNKSVAGPATLQSIAIFNVTGLK